MYLLQRLDDLAGFGISYSCCNRPKASSPR